MAIDLAPGDYDKVDLLWDLEGDVAWTDRAVRDGRHGRRWFRCLTFCDLLVIPLLIIGAYPSTLGFYDFRCTFCICVYVVCLIWDEMGCKAWRRLGILVQRGARRNRCEEMIILPIRLLFMLCLLLMKDGFLWRNNTGHGKTK
jgi:hypothetical protein